MLFLAGLAATPALATIYYVSPTGSDSNSGTNPLAPWGSVAKVDNTIFSPGDEILFQYGSTWNASLDTTSSGTVAAPIVYGTYGNPSLGNPTFMGSNPISSSAFSLVTGTTYQTTYSTPVNWTYINHQFTHEAQDALTQAGSSNANNPATDLSYVESTPDSFYYNAGSGQLFVNAGTNIANQTITAGVRDNAIYCNSVSNIVFQNLNTSETALDNAGYGIRVNESTNVQLLNSTVSLSGKHAIGVLDSTGFNGINLVGNGSAPDLGFGGASAFVNYASGSPPSGLNDTATWTNITAINNNGPYPVYISHATATNGIASLTINNVNCTSGYGTGLYIESSGSNETVLVNGGHLDGSSSVVQTNNSVVNGLTISGSLGSFELDGTNDVLQNCTFIGNTANVFGGRNGYIVDDGTQNTIRFNTVDSVSPGGPAIGILNPQSGTNIYGNILSPTGGGIGAIWLLFDGKGLIQSNDNLYGTTGAFDYGTISDFKQIPLSAWQAMGYDTSSVIGNPVYVNAPAGNYMLEPGSPGTGLYTGTMNPHLTVANSLLGNPTANGSYNAGLNPAVWQTINSLQSTLLLNSGLTNTITPSGNTLVIGSVGSILSENTSTLNIVGNVINAGTYAVLGPLIEAGNFNNSGTVYIAGSQLWGPGSVFKNLSGSATINTDVGGAIAPEEYLSMNVSGGLVIFASTQHLVSLTVGSGARVQLTSATSAGKSVLVTPSLAVSGTLDLTSNDLVVEAGNLTAVTTLVNSGYKAGNWTGNGITSSSAEYDTTHTTALGVILNSTDGVTQLYGYGAPLGLFDGESPAPNDVLVKYTYYGDTNLDGTVDGSDYARVDNGFLNHLTGWFNGDFNYDGVVNGSDYTLIDNAFNMQGAPPNAAITAQIANCAVPEPQAITAILLAVPLFWCRRSKYHDRLC